MTKAYVYHSSVYYKILFFWDVLTLCSNNDIDAFVCSLFIQLYCDIIRLLSKPYKHDAKLASKSRAYKMIFELLWLTFMILILELLIRIEHQSKSTYILFCIIDDMCSSEYNYNDWHIPPTLNNYLFYKVSLSHVKMFSLF